MASFKNAADYVNNVGNANIQLPTQLDVTPDGVIQKASTTLNVRELICSLLAGNGIKLPNLQICLKINIARAISDISGLDTFAGLAKLQAALNQAESALDEFIDHTGIESVLGRMNAAVAEFAAIANMINFCGTPVDPRPIPNVLDDAFGAFTGAGQELLDGLGKMADSDIGGCVSTDGGFNVGIFQSGALRDLGDLISDIHSGVTANLESRIDSIVNQLDDFAKDMRELVEFENNFAKRAVEGNQTGGSVFSPSGRIHTGVGMQIASDEMDLSTAQKYAGNLQYAYDNLKSYKLNNGRNIFEMILEPELISKLDGSDQIQPLVGERVPVLDYCGRETGEFQETIVQAPEETSTGSPVEAVTQPGALQTVGIISPPDSPIGRVGDTAGTIAYDNDFMYVCTAEYDGVSNIWIKSPLSPW